MQGIRNKDQYQGFEQGPIRPPSEAYSLLIRVTRNCPWNYCTFCPVYKDSRFSIRPVSHVLRDIDAVHRYIEAFKDLADNHGRMTRLDIRKLFEKIPSGDSQVFQTALNWYAGGMASIFIQDANSLIIKPADLIKILMHLKNRFPWVDRITSYARSHTIARISDDDLLKAVMERESITSTGTGDGIAIPHAKYNIKEELVMSVGIADKDIDFASLDNKPVRIFFMLLSRKDVAGLHIRMLAKIARFLRHEKFKKELLLSKTPEEVINIFKDEETTHFSK